MDENEKLSSKVEEEEEEEYLYPDPSRGDPLAICYRHSSKIFKDPIMMIRWSGILASNNNLQNGLLNYIFQQKHDDIDDINKIITFINSITEQLSNITIESDNNNKCVLEFKTILTCYLNYLNIIITNLNNKTDNIHPTLSKVFPDFKEQNNKDGKYRHILTAVIVNWIDCPKLFQELCLIDKSTAEIAESYCFGNKIWAYRLCTTCEWKDNMRFRFLPFDDHISIMQIIMDNAKNKDDNYDDDSLNVYSNISEERALLIASQFTLTNLIIDTWATPSLECLRLQDDIYKLFVLKKFTTMFKITSIKEKLPALYDVLNRLTEEKKQWVNIISKETAIIPDISSIIYDYWPVSKADDPGTCNHATKGYRVWKRVGNVSNAQ